MTRIIKLALRNIGRNPRRTLLTLLVVSVGTASMMLADAFILGTQKNMITLSTGLIAGQAQIHHPSFQSFQEAEFTIPNYLDVVTELDKEKQVIGYTKRVLITGMISSSRDSSMVQIYGVDFDIEPTISKLKVAVIAGHYPTVEAERPIVLGHKLADRLDVSEGDKVVVTSSEAYTGELVQELFRVVARVKFNSRPIDEVVGFIPINMAQDILKIEDGVHEIAIRFETLNNAIDPSLALWGKLDSKGVLAKGWDQIFPSLKAMIEMNGYSILIISLILFALISLSILNTMFMSIYERMFEFGVIKAIGTRSSQLASMIIIECIGIGILGVFLGVVCGGGMIYWYGQTGISFSDFEINGMSMVEPIRTIARWQQFTLVPLLILIMCGLAALYPAFHASRIAPAEAMQKTQ